MDCNIENDCACIVLCNRITLWINMCINKCYYCFISYTCFIIDNGANCFFLLLELFVNNSITRIIIIVHCYPNYTSHHSHSYYMSSKKHKQFCHKRATIFHNNIESRHCGVWDHLFYAQVVLFLVTIITDGFKSFKHNTSNLVTICWCVVVISQHWMLSKFTWNNSSGRIKSGRMWSMWSNRLSSVSKWQQCKQCFSSKKFFSSFKQVSLWPHLIKTKLNNVITVFQKLNLQPFWCTHENFSSWCVWKFRSFLVSLHKKNKNLILTRKSLFAFKNAIATQIRNTRPLLYSTMYSVSIIAGTTTALMFKGVCTRKLNIKNPKFFR